MGAVDGARGAIRTAGGTRIGQLEIPLTAQRKLTVTLGVGEAAENIGDGQTLLACALALAAHAAVEWADLFEVRGEEFFVGRRQTAAPSL